jgi:hypothetical protein
MPEVKTIKFSLRQIRSLGAPSNVLQTTRRGVLDPNEFRIRKPLMLRYFVVAGMLASIGWTTVMKYTPQEMSERVIDRVKVDQNTDSNPQTLASDRSTGMRQ